MKSVFQRLRALQRSRGELLVVTAVILGSLVVTRFTPLDRYVSLLLVTAVVTAGVVVLIPGAWATVYRTTGISGWAWLLAMGVFGGGIALSYFSGSPQVFCERSAPNRPCLTTYGWASIAFLASAFGGAVAVGHLPRFRFVRTAVAVPAAEAREGVVAVEGRVVPAGPTVTGPVSGAETAWYRSVLERATAVAGYTETDRELGGDAFYIEDGSGRVLVYPDHLDEYDVAELAESYTEAGNGRRRREWSYRPNDAVTAVGYASEVSRAEYPEPVVIGLEGPVLVGRRTVPELRSWAARKVVVGGGIALLVGGVSLFVMLMVA